ncbi:MAG: FliI/YscN family ATPase [Desulfobacterales bacterium]
MPSCLDLKKYRSCLDECDLICARGRVTNVIGLTVEASGPVCRLGTECQIQPGGRAPAVTAEVLGFRDERVLLMPLEEMRGIGPGCRVTALRDRAVMPVGRGLLGRVIDGLGCPIDGKGSIAADVEYPIYAEPLNPLQRSRIHAPLDIGVRAVNGLLTIGCGQRVGIFAGSGVGKSVLLGTMARHTAADVNVIALIGERGREVNEFIEKELGAEGLRRSVIVVATSDHLPLIRLRGAYIATAVAEYFRDLGLNVLLMMDSVTRFAMAQREIGLALGEPPTTKGYTPSVFTLLPRLLERAGTSAGSGTITGLYTVLVEGDDTNEPIADALRAILDGHICLSRELAMQNHYPAIDVLASISRVMDDIIGPGQRECARKFKSMLATYKKSEDLINIGAYVAGSNDRIDRAVRMINRINRYLTQGTGERVTSADSVRQLEELIAQADGPAAAATGAAQSA